MSSQDNEDKPVSKKRKPQSSQDNEDKPVSKKRKPQSSQDNEDKPVSKKRKPQYRKPADVEYFLGDLIWAKLGSHPYWASMVSYDPIEGCYWKYRKGKNKHLKKYHVQYFGKTPQRGWIKENATFQFRGATDFYNTQVKVSENARKFKTWRTREKEFKIADGVYRKWINASFDAEVAALFKPQKRYPKFVFRYVMGRKPIAKKAPPVKRHRKRKKESKKQSQVRKPSSIDEKLCIYCEKGSTDLICTGKCMQAFHKECLGICKAPANFKCQFCDKDWDSCLVCKVGEPDLPECNNCGSNYHDECIKKFQCANPEKKICPLHICLTCHTENPRNISSKGPFIRCFRCPTVFHATNKCIPAGSVLLTPTLLICPEHFLRKKKTSRVCNINYCVNCSDGGTLICCESCPNSYHKNCIDGTVPDGPFFCDSCLEKKYFYINMVVWAKTGNFRWWPAQIVDPEDAPSNVQNLKNHNGEFLIKFFGTGEYHWTHRGRVIPYVAEHKEHRFRPNFKQCKLTVNFKKSLEEAADAFDEYVLERQITMSPSRPAAYKHIKVNHAVPPAQIIVKSTDKCGCKRNDPRPCSSLTECINRSVLVECNPDICPAGEFCENQKFQKRQYLSVKVIKTERRGWGLQAMQFIPKGSFIIEYVGEVITHTEYHRRTIQMHENNMQNYYFLYLDSKRMIDAGPKGNLSRFINHSCSPNCIMEKWSVNGDIRIGIFSLVDVQCGEEITFNYQSDIKFEQRCYCGAPNCQGSIGKKAEKKKKSH